MILRCVGDVCHRWGPGLPAITVRQGNEGILDKIRQWIGNPTAQTWFLFPENWISKIEMLGVGGTMLDVRSLWELALEDVIIHTQIPYGILTGKEVAISGDAEVSIQQYYNTLDKLHSAEEEWLYRYFELDPTVKEIISDTPYTIDWGLRLVMSVEDKVRLETKLATLAQLQATVTTWNENREKQHLEKIETVVKNKELYKKLFGYTAEELGEVPVTLLPMLYTTKNPPPMGGFGQGGKGAKIAEGKRPDGSDNSSKDGGFQLSQRNSENQIAKQIADNLLTLYDSLGLNKFTRILGINKKDVQYKVLPKLRQVLKQ